MDDRETAALIDDQEHVFFTDLPARLNQAAQAGDRVVMEFAGVATIADVFLGDTQIASSTSMHNSFSVDVSEQLRATTDLVELRVVIRSLTNFLEATKWTRPRWKTRLVSDQRLRNVRTALLGRINWAPPTPVAGPYGGVTAVVLDSSSVENFHISTSLEHRDGLPVGNVVCALTTGPEVTAVRVAVGAHVTSCIAEHAADHSQQWTVTAAIPEPPQWMPHTHGSPTLVPVSVEITTSNGESVTHSCAPVGFRSVTVDESDGGFAISVNDIPIFVRGAVAFPFDVISGQLPTDELTRRLETAVRAGLNMIRLGNVGWYESASVHEVCDRLGILVWQDLAFASLDYPSTPEFQDQVRVEVQQQVTKLIRHPSTAIVCGSSEVEQQAAMMGVNPGIIAETPGRTWIADLVRESSSHSRHFHYVSSSPTGGNRKGGGREQDLPFRVNAGVAHYFGVGAYRRPLDDADSSGVRFASECLAFANVGSGRSRTALGERNGTLWKERVPKDPGSDWDFDDVREHYLNQLLDDTGSATDVQHAAITGNVMATTFSRWRAGQRCAGGLVLALQDPWNSAGWGLLDSDGEPKPALYRLSPALQPQAVLLIDRGLNGLEVCVANDAPLKLVGELTVRGVRHNGQVVLRATVPIDVGPHAKVSFDVETLWGRFADATYAYRFGASAFDVIDAHIEGSGAVLASAGYWVDEHWNDPDRFVSESDLTVAVSSLPSAEGGLVNVEVAARSVVRLLVAEADGWTITPNVIDVIPGRPVVLQAELRAQALASKSLLAESQVAPETLTLRAVNLAGEIHIPIGGPHHG